MSLPVNQYPALLERIEKLEAAIEGLTKIIEQRIPEGQNAS